MRSLRVIAVLTLASSAGADDHFLRAGAGVGTGYTALNWPRSAGVPVEGFGAFELASTTLLRVEPSVSTYAVSHHDDRYDGGYDQSDRRTTLATRLLVGFALGPVMLRAGGIVGYAHTRSETSACGTITDDHVMFGGTAGTGATPRRQASLRACRPRRDDVVGRPVLLSIVPLRTLGRNRAGGGTQTGVLDRRAGALPGLVITEPACVRRPHGRPLASCRAER